MRPPISIAMPYWNRPRELERSLAAYAKVYPDLDIEFSICDDGSTELPEGPPRQCKLTRLPAKNGALNPCVPINAAIRASTREIVVLTNPEIEHREPVLYDMLDALEWQNDYVMTGCRNANQRVGLSTVDGDWVAGPNAPPGLSNGRQPIPPGSHLHFCVMFHRELFDTVGGFDENYRLGSGGCEDNDWLWKLHALGTNFKYVPGTVWHYITRHGWGGKPGVNVDLLHSKWGHLPEFKQCAS